MIDTHNHLLPGLDDGARDAHEMVEMCRIALQDGIEGIVATPHALDGRYANDPGTIKALVAALNEKFATLKTHLRIFPGMEVRVSPELIDNLVSGRALTLNEGRYLLIEFYTAQIPSGFENLVQRLVKMDLRPILAHPEKNPAIQRNPEYLFKLIKLFSPWDILIQLTASSLTGENGFWARRTSKILLKSNLAHLIATDAHNSRSRIPLLSKGVDAAARIIGPKRALKMVQDIPKAVLEGQPFPEDWEPDNPRRWWRLL